MMSEARMLVIAVCSTVALSLIIAGGLYFFGAGPGPVVIGGTLAGIVTYVAICIVCSPLVPEPVLEVCEEGEDYV